MVKGFEAFCLEAGYKANCPIPVDQVLHYGVTLRHRGLAVSTIRGRLSAIAFASKSLGYPDYTVDFRIHRLLEGWRREEGPRRDHKQPLSPSILKGISSAWGLVCNSEYESRLFHVASLVAFFAALWISELVASNKMDESEKALQWGNILLHDNKVMIHIRVSKTNQAGKGKAVCLDPCADFSLCPVWAVSQYMAVWGKEPGFFFRHADKAPLTRFQFWG